MSDIEQLLAERRKSPFRLRFSGALEDRYRQNLRQLLRYPRTVLFMVIAVAFAISPLQEQDLFQVPPALHGVLATVAWLTSPICVAAAMLSYFPASPRSLTQAVQSAAVIAIFAAVFALRHLALTSDMQYPPAMLGVAITAVAIFGSFSAYRLIPLMLMFYAAGIAQELFYLPQQRSSELPAYVLSYLLLISVLGAYTNEILRRQSWIQGQSASALARVDLLTGLSNRSSFTRLYNISFNQARREQVVLALMVLDIDHFKRLNDSFGHHTGDEALRRLGAAISQVVAQRPLDICARLGGEEFVVVWYGATPEASARKAEGLLEAVRSIDLAVPGQEQPYRITASAGLTWLVPRTDTNPEQLLAKADALMYQAKNAGRDRLATEAFG